MSNIISRCDSLSAKVANLKKIMRADREKSKTKNIDQNSDADVVSALKTAIAQPKNKAKKRKDGEGTPIRKPISMLKTIEKKANGKTVEKTTAKISVKIDSESRDNRQTSRNPRKTKNDGADSVENYKKPLWLSRQITPNR